MWAVGAVFGELLNHAPMFPGENDIDQIYRVMQVLGTPTSSVWPVRPPPPCTSPPWHSLACVVRHAGRGGAA